MKVLALLIVLLFPTGALAQSYWDDCIGIPLGKTTHEKLVAYKKMMARIEQLRKEYPACAADPGDRCDKKWTEGCARVHSEECEIACVAGKKE